MAKDQLGRLLDESNGRLTQELVGRTIDHVVRKGLQLELVTECGHRVVIQADTNYNIHHIKTDVAVVVPGVTMKSIAGDF